MKNFIFLFSSLFFIHFLQAGIGGKSGGSSSFQQSPDTPTFKFPACDRGSNSCGTLEYGLDRSEINPILINCYTEDHRLIPCSQTTPHIPEVINNINTWFKQHGFTPREPDKFINPGW